MNIIGSCNAGMASAINGMKTAQANGKQDGRIAEAERTITVMTREIGNLTVLMLDGKRTVGPDIQERYDAIRQARAVIEEAKKQKIVTRQVCPVCGKHTSANMHYCGYCGSLLTEVTTEE